MWDISNMPGLKDFVETRLAQLGRNPFEAARKGGLERSFVNDILIEKKRSVQGANLVKLAAALDCDAADIVASMAGQARRLADQDPQTPRGSPAPEIRLSQDRLIPIKIAGKVEAGAFRTQEDLGDWDEAETIFEARDSRFPHARHLAFDVEGDSMNALRPRPIMPGDRVVALAYEDIASKTPLRDGMVVVVERTRHGGQEREWSIKQLELYEDRVEFHPRSTTARHKPIVVPRDHSTDDGVQVEIIALVTRVTNEFRW